MNRIKIWLTFTMILFLCQSSFADNFNNGVVAYNKHDYKSALSYFTSSLQENNPNALNLYYLGLTLKNLGESTRAQKAFNAALKLTPSADLLKKIKQELGASQQPKLIFNEQFHQKTQNTNSNNSSLPNYLAQAMLEGHVARWNLSKMPLQVYIQIPSNLEGYKTEFKSAIIKAVKAWETATKSKIRFVFTTEAKNANIKITWQKKFEGEKIGESPFISVNNTILKSDIVLSITMPDGRIKSASEVYSVALHEMGHALGIKGHSPYNNDVMYYSLNKENYASSLSPRDINTMNLLYKTEADISNSLPLSMSENKAYQKYLLTADKYMLQSDYKTALANLLSALKLYNNEYIPHFNAGICYIKLENYLNASNEFEKSIALNSKDVLSYYNAAVAQVKLAELTYSNDPAKKREYYIKAAKNLEIIQYKQGLPSNTIQMLAELKSRI